jgi:hypothetical protein
MEEEKNYVKQKIKIYEDFYKIKCPHCAITIVILKNELNCKIFRCGQYKSTGEQIPPHTSKIICDKLRETCQIIGCAKPFTFDGNCLEICEYI